MTGRYRAIKILGQSTRSRVWLAEGPDGPCVVKVAHHGQSLQLQLEAHRGVNHPALAPCLDADPGATWYALPYYSLGPVDLWARGQPWEVVVETTARLADAVEHLHSAGFIHGDLKPSNILVGTDGQAHILDIGDSGAGTPGWRAPELERGEPADRASDAYGLGAVFYAMVARRPPFHENEGYGRARLPEPPSSARPRLPAAFEEIVLSLLNPVAALRPPLQGLAERIRETRESPPLGTVVVGMAKERETLRRAVTDVLQGQSRVVIVFGPLGCGRRTLIREALVAARRIGLLELDQAPPMETANRALATAIALEGNNPTTDSVAQRILTSGRSSLAFIHSERSHPELARAGAWHVRPPPLTGEEVAVLLESAGRDRRAADELRRRTRGHPAALHRVFHHAREPAPVKDPVSNALFEALRAGPLPVPLIAERLGLTEHRLLDLAEPLLDQGLVNSSADGFVLSLGRI